MRQCRAVMAVIILGLTACAAPAPEQSEQATSVAIGEQPVEKVAVAEDESKLICRKERKRGSRLKTKVCRTQFQLDEEREAAQNMLRETGLGGRGSVGAQ